MRSMHLSVPHMHIRKRMHFMHRHITPLQKHLHSNLSLNLRQNREWSMYKMWHRMLFVHILGHMHIMLPELHFLWRPVYQCLPYKLHPNKSYRNFDMCDQATVWYPAWNFPHKPVVAFSAAFHNFWPDSPWGRSHLEATEQKHFPDRPRILYLRDLGVTGRALRPLRVLFQVRVWFAHCLPALDRAWNHRHVECSWFLCAYRTACLW